MSKMVDKKRRRFLRTTVAALASAALSLPILEKGANAVEQQDALLRSSGLYETGRHPIYHDAEKPEATVNPQTGQIDVSDEYFMRPTICLGCRSMCGAVAKVRRSDNQIVRMLGNPYDPHSTLNPLPYDSPVKTILAANSQLGVVDTKNGRSYVMGFENRSSLCARGTATWQVVYDPYRIMTPLKRAGPRGSGKWRPITWEQLIDETVKGGKIFSDIGEDDEYWGILDVAKDYVDPVALVADAFPKLIMDDEVSNDLATLGVAQPLEGNDFRAAAELLFRKFDDAKSHTRSWLFLELKRLLREDEVFASKYRQKLINPERPEYGPKSNQFVFAGGRISEVRGYFAKTWFVASSLGSHNNYEHTNICELSHHVSHLLVTGKAKGGGNHFKADINNAEYVIFFGTSPGNANFPMQTIQKRTAVARSSGKLRYTLVDPVLQWGASNIQGVDWQPIRPGTDGALALAIIRWIIENERYDSEYLSTTNQSAAQARGDHTFTDATFLVVVGSDKTSADKVKASDLGLGGSDEYVVIDPQTGQPQSNTGIPAASLEWEGQLTNSKGNSFSATTVFSLLKGKAFERTLEEWSKICGVSTLHIADLAREITSHGKKAAVTFYRGPIIHPNGFWNALGLLAINTLIGNWNRKGGYITSRSFGYQKGRYDLTSFPNARRDWGLRLTGEKSKFAPKKYEESTEFQEKKYPAQHMWYPFAFDVFSEILPNHVSSSPYSAKVLLFHKSDAIFTVPSTSKELVDKLRDTLVEGKKPLHLICDLYINETGGDICDYIIPDTTRYERWNINTILPGAAPWKGSRTRVPVIPEMPGDEKRRYSLEQYFIDVVRTLNARGLQLGGVGEAVVKDSKGTAWPIESREDFYLKAIANLAYDGWVVGDASLEDLQITGYDEFQTRFPNSLNAEEWPKVLYVLTRGGKYDSKLWDGDFQHNKVEGLVRFYIEEVAKSRHPITGQHFDGIASWIPPITNDGKPLWNETDGYASDPETLNLITYKMPLTTQSKYGAYNMPLIREIIPENWLELNSSDASKKGIEDGNIVEVQTKVGKRIGKAKVREGITPGIVAYANSFGHSWSGVKNYELGEQTVPGNLHRGLGIQANPIMVAERQNHNPTDPVGGNASFAHTPIAIRKIG